MKKIRYMVEAFFTALLFRAFRALPLDISSWLGSIIGQAVGPFFSANRIAKANIGATFPELTPFARAKILRRMWAHLGRIAAEFSSLPGDRLTSRIIISGTEHLPKNNGAALFVSGHIGNWELLYPMAFDRSIPIAIVYRHINNPIIDTIVIEVRKTHATTLVRKGMKGAVDLLKALKRGESVAMLVDQKMNGGIPVKFFGREAMTAPAIAELALKYDLPIIPVRVIRTHGAHFKGLVYPTLDFKKTDNHEHDVAAMMLAINQMLEGWIREYPEQWFWVHKRWPKV